jgi:hypothetical protein
MPNYWPFSPRRTNAALTESGHELVVEGFGSFGMDSGRKYITATRRSEGPLKSKGRCRKHARFKTRRLRALPGVVSAGGCAELTLEVAAATRNSAVNQKRTTEGEAKKLARNHTAACRPGPFIVAWALSAGAPK